ncbi:SDR family oxidoreductase [Cellulosimicrobium arenosum]|uniref:SDR family oxidoreductase n=1 Tax=Cellulosimicrobium arenosum TaxID=2708133 RepID=A0A927J131_9MICO|nr:SDR family oxidoreductase [Cellulosimicrobium arenosum]MBD8079927.1 SDR family oxidoreductase [Cellulosimicrobium arenosum]
MKIALVGAHGKVGRVLIPILAEHGDTVLGIVRKEGQPTLVEELGAQPLLLDVGAASTDEIAEAVRGSDAVVWSAGAGGGSPERTYAVDRDAAIRTIDAAAAAGVPRFVMVSWIGSVAEHGVDPESAFYPYAEAKLAADDHLRASDLEWTVLGPGTLSDDPPTGAIHVLAEDEEIEGGPGLEVSRADVAMVVAQALHSDSAVGRFVRFTSGDTPILEAFGH